MYDHGDSTSDVDTSEYYATDLDVPVESNDFDFLKDDNLEQNRSRKTYFCRHEPYYSRITSG